MRFFFYGSLLDPAIRRVVMGRCSETCRVVPATLSGWRRCRRREAIYPVLMPSPGAVVEGCLIEGVDAVAAARLTAFEGSAYRVAVLQVRLASGGVAAAFVFLPNRRLASPSSWSPAEWSRGRQRRALRLANAEMAWEGRAAMRRPLISWRRRSVSHQ
jgi:hypothetical protein